MGTRIFPSHNDVGDNQGDGNRGTEENLSDLYHRLMAHRKGVISGMTVSNPSGLTVRVAVGKCWINGHFIETDAVIDMTATDDATSYQHVRLTRDGNSRVTGVTGSVLSSISTDDDFLLVSRVDASSGSVDDFYKEYESHPGIAVGKYTGNNVTGQIISLGRMPSMVIVSGEKNGSPMMGLSQIDAPGNRRSVNYATGRVSQSRVAFGPAIETKLVSGGGVNPLSGSGSISTGTISAGASMTDTITVTGAAVGDAVVVWATGTDAEHFCWTARVSGTNTVTVRAYNHSTASQSSNATVYVVVMKPATLTLADDCQFIENSGLSALAPVILEDGFAVSPDTWPALNNSGIDYNYIAFF